MYFKKLWGVKNFWSVGDEIAVVWGPIVTTNDFNNLFLKKKEFPPSEFVQN